MPDVPDATPKTDDAAISFVGVLRYELAEISKLRRKRQWTHAQDMTNEQVAVAYQVKESQSAPAAKTGSASAAEKQRAADQVFQDASKSSLVGLAFSGGGIRSATFNLGVLQGLAGLRLLPMFDYLSTVSGGGYIGSWLCGWIWRTGRKENVENDTAEERQEKCPDTPGESPPIQRVQEELKPGRATKAEHQEPRPIRFLREYSNYLTPRMGVLGADTWTAVGIYMRNLLLNQTILVLFLASVLLLPHIAIWITHVALAGKDQDFPGLGYLRLIAIVALLLVALIVSARNMKNLTGIRCTHCDAAPKWYFPWYAQQGWILALVGGPLFVAAWIAATYLGEHDTHNWSWWYWAVIGLAVFGVTWAVASLWNLPEHGPAAPHWSRRDAWLWSMVFSFVSGAVGGLLLWLLGRALFSQGRYHVGGIWYAWHAVSFGPPLVVLSFLVVGGLQIGLMGLYFPDPRREWWARLGGYLLIASIIWSAVFGVAVYAPLGLMWLRGWLKGVGLVWIASTLAGIFGGRSAETSGTDARSWKSLALIATPYVFIVGFASVIAWLLEVCIATVNGETEALTQFVAGSPVAQKVSGWVISLDSAITSGGVHGTMVPNIAASVPEWKNAYYQAHWRILVSEWHGSNWRWLFVLFVAFIAVCALMSVRVNLNEFSMNLFYRNRLVRAYLGASHEHRMPNPFTGFDPHDELQLRDLRADQCYGGPLPIVNAALNLVSGKDLAWQERKAESFILTPLRCGFDTRLEQIDLKDEDWPGRNNRDLQRHAYRPAEHFAFEDVGLRLGTAVSISGAAASPNMGYHSSPALAFLMTVFNVRLGYWLGNPRRDSTWRKPGPQFGLLYLLAELFGQTNDEARHIYLSDGGHFENLGLYELVKRRCKYIIVCDADCDNKYAFGDLGNAIRKCREDFGVEIEIDTSQIGPKTSCGEKNSQSSNGEWHWAVGKIHYDLLDAGAEPGTLVYLKTSLTGDEQADVLNYQKLHPDFPHQTTADQWFTESQFESYRRLGQHVVEMLFEPLEDIVSQVPEGSETGSAEKFTKELFDRLEKQWS